jgi:predicted dienelactone hydrolase
MATNTWRFFFACLALTGCAPSGGGSQGSAAAAASTPVTTPAATVSPPAPPPPPPPAPVVDPVGGPADPSLPGPWPTTRQVLTVTTAGQTSTIDVRLPAGARGPRPTVLINHGWAATSGQYASLAEHLASRGFAGALFQQPSPLSNSTPDWSTQLRGAIDGLAAANAAASGPLSGQLDLANLGAVGHSYGGATVIWAAADDPRIKVVVGMAPVNQPNFNALLTQSSRLAVPLLVEGAQFDILSIPLIYTRPIYDAAPAAPAKLYIEIANGNHNDFADVGQGTKQYTLSEQYETAWLEHFLGGLPDTSGWTDGTKARADLAAGLLSNTH